MGVSDGTIADDRRRVALPPWVVAVVSGAVVSLLIGTYARTHDRTNRPLFGFDPNSRQMITFKAWFTALALFFALIQVLTALRMYGKLPYPKVAPSWLGTLHRLTGTLAYLAVLPVAYHCLWALGFEARASVTRPFVHSIAGCFFFGAFTAKMISVRSHRMPGSALPVFGGLTFAALTVLFLTSSLWFWTEFSIVG